MGIMRRGNARLTKPGSARPAPWAGAFAPSQAAQAREGCGTINGPSPARGRAHPGPGAARLSERTRP